MFLFFLMALLFSCATPPVPVDTRWVTKTEVMTENAARKLMADRRKFLLLTFEQVRDLNFSTMKWNPGCLTQNKVGEIRDEWGAIIFISELPTDKEFRTGLCLGDFETAPAKFVSLFCKNKNTYYEFRCWSKECGDYKWKSAC